MTYLAANAHLHRAFPWGALVDVPSGSSFLSIAHEIELVSRDRITVRFHRDPGDAALETTLSALEHGAHQGVIVGSNHVRVRRPEAADAYLLTDPFDCLVGPQAISDDHWTARMRLHQSWWRTFRLRVPFGRGPGERDGSPRGNYLDRASAEQGLNFLSSEARVAYQTRIRQSPEGVDRNRTERNLLASQPLAFNLFGHLGFYPEALASALRELVDPSIERVADVQIERLSEALGDRTAFDAFIRCKRRDGSPVSVAVETKLTEPFSQQAYDWTKYTAHAAFSTDIWRTTDPLTLGDKRWSQLWRNHLLAQAEAVEHPEVGEIRSIVVHHPLDPHCRESAAGYCELLTDPASVKVVDVGSFIEALSSSGEAVGDGWLSAFDERYLRVENSEPLAGVLISKDRR